MARDALDLWMRSWREQKQIEDGGEKGRTKPWGTYIPSTREIGKEPAKKTHRGSQKEEEMGEHGILEATCSQESNDKWRSHGMGRSDKPRTEHGLLLGERETPFLLMRFEQTIYN